MVWPYGVEVPNRAFEQLRDAYATAWESRQRTRDDSPATLLEELTRRGLEAFEKPGPLRDLLLSLWDRAVPPTELDREIRRALPGIAWTAVGSMAKATVEVARILVAGHWEQVDLSWQDMPEGHRKLSDARKANDLVLRWLHKPVDKITLDIHVDNTVAIERCREAPSANRDGWAEAHCWLQPHELPTVEVKVGKEHVGWTVVPDRVWDALKREEKRRIYADGSLLLNYYGPQIELVCYLPRERE
jgi:hypothetical protein